MDRSAHGALAGRAYSVPRKKTTRGRGVEGKEETEMMTIRNRIHALYRVWIVQS